MGPLRILLVLPVAACIAGCRRGPGPDAEVEDPAPKAGAPVAPQDLIGHWISTEATQEKATSDFVFRKDGSYGMTVSGMDHGKPVTTVAAGGYRLKNGNKCELIPRSVTNTSPDPAKQAELDTENARLATALVKPPVIKGTIEWKAKDTIELTMNDTVGSTTPSFKLRRKE